MQHLRKIISGNEPSWLVSQGMVQSLEMAPCSHNRQAIDAKLAAVKIFNQCKSLLQALEFAEQVATDQGYRHTVCQLLELRGYLEAALEVQKL